MTLDLLLQSPWLNRLGEALLHSLWQGAIVWLLLGVMLLALRRSSARVRHLAALAALSMMLALPVGTMIWLGRGLEKVQPPVQVTPSVTTDHELLRTAMQLPASGNIPQSADPIAPRPLPERAAPSSAAIWQAVVAVLWAAGVAFLTLRLVAGWWVMRRLHRGASRCTAPWLPRVLDRAALPAARVLCSARLQVPVVAGWIRPVIYLPASLFGRMSLAAAETVLLHELAHLRRRDPLLNLWITTVETLLFFNPPVRAIAGTARDEAECACDDQVLAWGGDRPTYARALARLEAERPSTLVLAATGGSSLLHRIQRILGSAPAATRLVVSQTLGMAILATITGFLLVCTLAVPPLARAFTPEERIAALAAVEATLPMDERWEWEAHGRLIDEDGKVPQIGNSFHVCAWSLGYTSHSSENSASRFSVTGHGQSMRAGLWLDGYAPASVIVPASNDAATPPEFSIPLNRGYPATLKLVNESGSPVADAYIRVEVVFAYNEQMHRQSPLRTSPAGETIIGNADANSAFRIEVRAHGYEWTWFEKTTFARDQPTILTLKAASPVLLSVAEDQTGVPVAGASAFCASWSSGDRNLSYGSRSMLASMAREPSNAQGELALDLCARSYTYDLLVEAPGYGIRVVKITPSKPPAKVSLTRELRLGGVIRDPSRLFSRNTKETIVGYSLDSDSGGSWKLVNFNMQFETVAQRLGTDVHFSIGQLNAGEIELRDGSGRDWKTTLTESKEDLVLYMSKAGLTIEDPSRAPIMATPQREVRFLLLTPNGQPPAQGNLQLRMDGRDHALPVGNGISAGTFPVGARLSLRRYGLAGYTWKENQRDIKVDPGPGIQEIDIVLIPSGGLTGNIAAAPAQTRFMKLDGLVLRRSSEVTEARPVDGEVWITNNEQSYSVTSLPLDEEYRVILRSGTTLSESEWVRVSSTNPLPEASITHPDGRTIKGKVLESDGSPASQVRLSLTYQLRGWSYQFHHYNTAADGSFSLNGINFDVEGTYTLIINKANGSVESTTPVSKGDRSLIITRPPDA